MKKITCKNKDFSFSYEIEEKDITKEESLRMLGVTLYHLKTGQSELNYPESFLLDGYREIESKLWPIIDLLVNKNETDLDKIEKMLKEIKEGEKK